MIPVAVTVAPRPTEPEVHAKCFRSMEAAGFSELTIFAEPGKYAAMPTLARFYMHRDRLGEFHNFMFAVRAMLTDFPRAERVMTCQDDVAWCRNAADFLSKQEWPTSQCGCVHAYTSRKYCGYSVGLTKLETSHARNMAGACGLVFSRQALQCLIDCARSWRGHTRDTITTPEQMEGVDTFIGEALTDNGFEIWINNPSLGQHIAKDSTLGHGGPFGSRVAANWQGEEVDAFTLQR